MLVVFVTHPEAKEVPRGHVRALSKVGRDAACEAGTRLLSLLPPLLKEFRIERVNSLVSSPSTRCVETLVWVADTLSAITQVDEITVADELKEQRNGEYRVPLSVKSVSQVLRCLGPGAALVALHGDLPSILTKGAIHPSALQGDWFRDRIGIVIAVVDYDLNRSIEEGRLLVCEKYNGTEWESIKT